MAKLAIEPISSLRLAADGAPVELPSGSIRTEIRPYGGGSPARACAVARSLIFRCGIDSLTSLNDVLNSAWAPFTDRSASVFSMPAAGTALPATRNLGQHRAATPEADPGRRAGGSKNRATARRTKGPVRLAVRLVKGVRRDPGSAWLLALGLRRRGPEGLRQAIRFLAPGENSAQPSTPEWFERPARRIVGWLGSAAATGRPPRRSSR